MEKVYFTGRPTGPDVEAIVKAIPVKELIPGKTINYADIEKIIGFNKDQSRFQTVTNCWRKKLWRENNILLESIPNIGYAVQDNSARTSTAARGIVSASRKLNRSGNIARRTSEEGLTEEQKKTRVHIINVVGSMMAIEAAKVREIKFIV